MKHMLAPLLMAVALNSCVSSPTIETTGLVINESRDEYFLRGEVISEEEAEKHLEHAKPEEIVVFVEGNEVGVYTVEEVDKFMSHLFTSISPGQKVHRNPLLEKGDEKYTYRHNKAAHTHPLHVASQIMNDLFHPLTLKSKRALSSGWVAFDVMLNELIYLPITATSIVLH